MNDMLARHLKPMLIRYLKQLNHMLGLCDDSILAAKLADDMLPFGAHAAVVNNFAKRMYYPLVNRPVVLVEQQNTIAETQAILEVTINALLALPNVHQFDDSLSISDRAGFEDIALPQSEYVMSFALPNFYFHLSMVYAIGKVQSVPLSKGDFDGYHSYPANFSFK
ncbi:DUF1993 family protein [Thalassotalea euphylliae]|uniref:DUF1993 family protein n=1 Tax=Thalassotalea euphylliae TaxID=1655234 RepID=UPI0036282543